MINQTYADTLISAIKEKCSPDLMNGVEVNSDTTPILKLRDVIIQVIHKIRTGDIGQYTYLENWPRDMLMVYLIKLRENSWDELMKEPE